MLKTSTQKSIEGEHVKLHISLKIQFLNATNG